MSENTLVENPKSSSTGSEQKNEKVNPTEIQVKHPLQNAWELWYYKPISQNFEENLFNITSVDTVEDFWGLYNHLEHASKLNLNCGYYFFKKGIRPMWEDATNNKGGRWVFNLKKGFNVTDQTWMELLLCLIGEAFDDSNDNICGAFVLVKRGNDRLGVWTKEATNRDANMHIGEVIKRRCELNCPMVFEAHDSTANCNYQL